MDSMEEIRGGLDLLDGTQCRDAGMQLPKLFGAVLTDRKMPLKHPPRLLIEGAVDMVGEELLESRTLHSDDPLQLLPELHSGAGQF